MWRFIGKNKTLSALLVGVAISLPAWASAGEARNAVPGTVNYVEGQAYLGNESLNSKSAGSTELQPGQSLSTQQGKAEFLLTPGVFVRLGDHSSAQMISPDLTHTEFALQQGEALVEVDEIHPENNLQISEAGTTTRLLKAGLYDFDAAHDQVRVFDGKASVLDGDEKITVKGGHELTLHTAGKLKARGFDKKQYAKSDDLYQWSSLRSAYLADANEKTAQVYLANDWYGPGWTGAGWYWSPWFGAYTFIPADGFLYSPFGWGFYSPLWVYRAPGYGYGNYYHNFAHFNPGVTRRVPTTAGGAFGPGFHGGAVRAFGNGAARGTFRSEPGMRTAAPFGSHTATGMTGGFHAGGGFGGAVRR